MLYVLRVLEPAVSFDKVIPMWPNFVLASLLAGIFLAAVQGSKKYYLLN